MCEKEVECSKCKKDHLDILYSDEPFMQTMGMQNRDRGNFRGRNIFNNGRGSNYNSSNANNNSNTNNNNNNAIEEVDLSENPTA